LRHIIQIYPEITPDTLEKINVGVTGGDIEQVALAAHSLKGSSAELGAEQLAELCRQLYMEVKAGNRESVALLAGEVSRCYRETSTAMDTLEFG
jgi:HPt (histidine-containing phosphotransfer) domain-containing protein